MYSRRAIAAAGKTVCKKLHFRAASQRIHSSASIDLPDPTLLSHSHCCLQKNKANSRKRQLYRQKDGVSALLLGIYTLLLLSPLCKVLMMMKWDWMCTTRAFSYRCAQMHSATSAGAGGSPIRLCCFICFAQAVRCVQWWCCFLGSFKIEALTNFFLFLWLLSLPIDSLHSPTTSGTNTTADPLFHKHFTSP